MTMTMAELYREIARLIEEIEALNLLIHQKDAEIEALKSKPGEEAQQWFTPREAAEFIRRSTGFLDKDRMKRAPAIPFIKEGYRTVRYHRNDLEAYSSKARIRMKNGKLSG